MNRVVTVAAACGLSFAAGMGALWAQQQQQKSHREPQFENGKMEAHYTLIMPHEPLTLHRHDHGRAIVALTDGVLKVEDKNGKVMDTYNWKKNHAYWLDKDPPGQVHADVNDTNKPIEVMVVELRGDTKP
jgi:quercetin dioxygenase-like cupin family protein